MQRQPTNRTAPTNCKGGGEGLSLAPHPTPQNTHTHTHTRDILLASRSSSSLVTPIPRTDSSRRRPVAARTNARTAAAVAPAPPILLSPRLQQQLAHAKRHQLKRKLHPPSRSRARTHNALQCPQLGQVDHACTDGRRTRVTDSIDIQPARAQTARTTTAQTIPAP
jgi:hypothetical protein